MRVYLTGPLCIEAGEQLLGESALPGPQGRHLLGFLAAEHARPLCRDEIADEIWPGSLPPAWESSLKALVSKLRAALVRAGLPGAELIRNAFGAYQFRLPHHGWVDVDAVVLTVHLAEAALAAGNLDDTARHAFVARLITARPFLPGIEGLWADERRRKLTELRIRAIECMAEVQLQRGQATAAVLGAELVLDLDELRESGWRILMRAHATAGNLSTALRAYERCCQTLNEQLGTPPSALTRAAHSELLR